MKPEKQITLLAAAIIILSLFYLLPANQEWMASRIVPYWNDFLKQKSNLDIAVRKQMRYKGAYTYSKQIAGFFAKKDPDSVLILIPSTSYFNKHGIRYHVPEPAVFYYYTGLKTVWSNQKDAYTANWVVRAEKGKIIIDSITSRKNLADTISKFNQTPPEL